jgi:hypothetical protein
LLSRVSVPRKIHPIDDATISVAVASLFEVWPKNCASTPSLEHNYPCTIRHRRELIGELLWRCHP